MKAVYYSYHPAGRGPFDSRVAGQGTLLLGPLFKAGDPSTAPSPVPMAAPQPEPMFAILMQESIADPCRALETLQPPFTMHLNGDGPITKYHCSFLQIQD